MVKELVERIRKQDQRAMSELYQQYVDELSSVCYRYVPDESDAKDVLQNSFVKIFQSIATLDFRGEEALKAWMKRVVANEALRHLKTQKRLTYIDYNDVDLLLMTDDDEPEAEHLSPDELHKLISGLPDGYRTVLNLYVFEGYSHRQIAELLGINESTSASQLYYARRLLARRIKELMKGK